MKGFARITGTGSYLPDKVLTNKDLEAMVETTDQWIRERTGIVKRHIAVDGQTTCDLAEQAARRAIEAAGRTPQDIDLIVLATTTPDKIFPALHACCSSVWTFTAVPLLTCRPCAPGLSMRWL